MATIASNSDNIDVISNDWLVPPYPSQSGALVYLFNGVEPTKGGYIMQPVFSSAITALSVASIFACRSGSWAHRDRA